jgi:hypothetical protein
MGMGALLAGRQAVNPRRIRQNKTVIFSFIRFSHMNLPEVSNFWQVTRELYSMVTVRV